MTELLDAGTALALARTLAGDWVGSGQAHGRPVEARLQVRVILGGSFVELREWMDGYEDLSLYRQDPETRELRVLHVQEGGVLDDHPVEAAGMTLAWITGPRAPHVEWSVVGEGLRCAVTFPGFSAPEIEVLYRREASGV